MPDVMGRMNKKGGAWGKVCVCGGGGGGDSQVFHLDTILSLM